MKVSKYAPGIVTLLILIYIALQERESVEEKFSPCSIHISVNYIVSRRKFTINSTKSLQGISRISLPIQFYILNDDSSVIEELPRSRNLRYTYLDRSVNNPMCKAN